MLFRKRPVVIEARRWNGDNYPDLYAWGNPGGVGAKSLIVQDHADPSRLVIETPEGTMVARMGDWIICGVSGEMYPCKHDIFELTYERVNAEPPTADDVAGLRRG